MSDMCHCGNEAAVKVVRKEGRNQGRWFATCATQTCKFFKWEDGVGNRPDPPPSRPPQTSPHLGLRRPTTLQQMRGKAEQLAGGADELAMAATEYNRKRGRGGDDDEVEVDECGDMLSALTKTTAGLVACTERLKRHEIIMEKVVSLLSKCKCWGGRKSPSPGLNPNEPEEIDDDPEEEEEAPAPPPTKKSRPLTLSDKFNP